MNALKQNTPNPQASTWYGPFYYAPGDPRISVRKRWGFGWIFNFARAGTYSILTALLAVPAGRAAILLLGR